MKRTSLILAFVAMLVCRLSPLDKFSMTRDTQAQEPARPTLPTAEMQRLAKFYVRTWDYTENYPKSPRAPEGGQNTGVYTSELGPGGNSLINRFHSRGPVGDFEGLLVMSWEPREKNYKEYIFGSDHAGTLVATGQWEGDALVYRVEFPTSGVNLTLRNVTRLTAPGKLVSEQFSSVNGAPETLLVRVEATKRP
ncbi:MAG TPA: hypothetical protein VGF20_07605 [Candidatus Acidoferrum sp.]